MSALLNQFSVKLSKRKKAEGGNWLHFCLLNVGRMRIKIASEDIPHRRHRRSRSLYILIANIRYIEVRIWGGLSTTLYELILSPSPPFDLIF